MLYDDENLYFAARLQEENVWGHLTKRDTIVYYDNDFEIFLDPTANAVAYFEFEVNPLNTMFDMFHENDNNLDRYETTTAEYSEFLNEGGRDEFYDFRMAIPELCGIVKEGAGAYRVIFGRGEYPVVFVRQEWALAYAESRGKSLPTEAMWERAAIGLEGRVYPWGDEPLDPSRANYDFHYGGALPVGSLPQGATPEEIHDMLGNAREWTISKIYPYPGGAEYEYHIAPWWYPGQKKFDRIWWVARGGGWSQQEACMSPKYRNSLTVMDGGIRCVKLSPPSKD